MSISMTTAYNADFGHPPRESRKFPGQEHQYLSVPCLQCDIGVICNRILLRVYREKGDKIFAFKADSRRQSRCFSRS